MNIQEFLSKCHNLKLGAYRFSYFRCFLRKGHPLKCGFRKSFLFLFLDFFNFISSIGHFEFFTSAANCHLSKYPLFLEINHSNHFLNQFYLFEYCWEDLTDIRESIFTISMVGNLGATVIKT